MADELMEEDLLRSIEEVDSKITDFRKRVRALLADIEAQRQQPQEVRGRAEVS